MAKILIAEDDRALNEGIRLTLRQQDWEFCQAFTIKEARQLLEAQHFDLVLLDINFPDGSGLDLLPEVKEKTPSAKVILLTANNMEMDIVTGLESGADDYITKPFSLMVLRARVGVQLRKGQGADKDSYEQGDFYFDFKRMIFRVGGVPVELSKTEQKLLHFLVENRGRTVSRELLIDRVWDGDSEFVDGHALTVSIKRLRDKLGEDSKDPAHLKTARGIGYSFHGSGE